MNKVHVSNCFSFVVDFFFFPYQGINLTVITQTFALGHAGVRWETLKVTVITHMPLGKQINVFQTALSVAIYMQKLVEPVGA